MFIGLINCVSKLNLCLSISVFSRYCKAYPETRIVVGGLAHVPELILVANLNKGKFVI